MRIKDNTTLYEILDQYTNEWLTFIKTTLSYDGTVITSSNESVYIDGIIYIKINSEFGGGYAKRVLPDNTINLQWFGLTANGVIDEFTKFKDICTLSANLQVPLTIPTGMNVNLGGNPLPMASGVTLMFKGGILSNGTIVGNVTRIIAKDEQIFSTNISLSGTFNMEYICPQHYGAITNISNEVFENDCSAAIQACIDSPINIYLPEGFYYISSGIEFTSPKNFKLCGKFSNNSTLIADHARIYTDQNINLVSIKAGDVYIKGGTWDVSQVFEFTNDVFRYDLNFPMWGGEIDTKGIGSIVEVAKEGIGGNLIRFDQSDITEVGGYAVFMKFVLEADNFHTGVLSDTKVGSIYINSLTFDCKFRSMKQFYYINIGLSDSYFNGFYQCNANIINPSEEELYPIYMGGFSNYVDGVVFDPDNQKVINMVGFNNTIGPRLQTYFQDQNRFTSFYNIKSNSIVSPLTSYIPRFRVNPALGTIISKLDSDTIGWDNTSTVTINAYKGDGIDFDAALSPTIATPTSDITIGNPTNFFNFGVTPTLLWTGAADLDVDFVEIVSTAGSTPHDWNAFYLYVSQATNNRFKRIQIIDLNTDLTVSNFNIYPTQPTSENTRTFAFTDFPRKTSSQTIIRFIGNEIADSSSGILSIDGIRGTQRNFPFIHTLGGQRIYGNITANDYRIPSLNSAPASTAATGTLGEIRFTADHIYVCTATNTWKRVAIATW